MKIARLLTFLILLVVVAGVYAYDIEKIDYPLKVELGETVTITGEFSYDTIDATYWAVELFAAQDMPIGPEDTELDSFDIETPPGMGTQNFDLSVTAPSSETRWDLVVTLWVSVWNEDIQDYEWILSDEREFSVEVVTIEALPPAEGLGFPSWIITAIILGILGLLGIGLVTLKLVLPKKPPKKITLKDIEDPIDELEDWNSDKEDGKTWIWKVADEATEKELSKLSKWDKTVSGSVAGATPWMLKMLRDIALSTNRFDFKNAKDELKGTLDANPHLRGNLKGRTIKRWKAQEFREKPLDPSSHSRAKTIKKFNDWINYLAKEAKKGGMEARSSIINRIQTRYKKVKGKKKLVNKTHRKVKNFIKRMRKKIKVVKKKAQEVEVLKRKASQSAEKAKKYAKAERYKEAKRFRKQEKTIRKKMKESAKEAEKARAKLYNKMRRFIQKKLQKSIHKINKIENFIKTGK